MGGEVSRSSLLPLPELALEVSAAEMIEYVRELNDAGLIVVDAYRGYPARFFTKLAPEQLPEPLPKSEQVER